MSNPAMAHATKFAEQLKKLVSECGYDPADVKVHDAEAAATILDKPNNPPAALVTFEADGFTMLNTTSVEWDGYEFALEVPDVEGSWPEPHAAWGMSFYDE